MTELEHIEIEGFKGLEHVEFEPTDINLITGRNNTGKTSFLEAVDLLFDPSRLTGFSPNLDKLVNVEFQQSKVQGRVSGEEINLRVRYPDKQEGNEYLTKAVSELLSSATRWHVDEEKEGVIVGQDSPPEWINDRTFESILRKTARQTINRIKIPDINKKCVVLEASSSNYPFVYLGSLKYKIFEQSLEELEEVVEKELDNLSMANSSFGVAKITKGSTEVHLSLRQDEITMDSVFLGDIQARNKLDFITPEDSVFSPKDITADGNGIKIDDIGDYIRRTSLVEGLKTFTLDYLVFEENGEKYDIPYEFMGDGFKAMIGLLWELMDDDVEEQIVLIEEPETHMHPGYVLKLVSFLIDLARDENVQFFITTHDHDFIKDFFADMPDEKRDYLEDEFSLVRMDDFGAEVLDYETAEHNLKDLHLDLRGI